MFSRVFTFGLMATSAIAWEALNPPTPKFGAMSPRGMSKRQDGYYPDTTTCGQGETCQEACGPTYEECSGTTPICFDPTKGQHCCNDGTGYGCNKGDYCSHDSAGLTYCCPEGMDLASCAAAYSLTGALETALPTPTAALSASSTEEAEDTATLTVTDDSTEETTATDEPTSTESDDTPSPTKTKNVTSATGGAASSTRTGPGVPEFTGGAAKVAKAGMAVLAGAAVFL